MHTIMPAWLLFQPSRSQYDHLQTSFKDQPDQIKTRQEPGWNFHQGRIYRDGFFYLDFPGPIVHHAMLGGHGLVGVQRGGVEGDLLHVRNATDGVGLAGARGLVLVFPVGEELLEERSLAPCWHDLDLQAEEMNRLGKRTITLQW